MELKSMLFFVCVVKRQFIGQASACRHRHSASPKSVAPAPVRAAIKRRPPHKEIPIKALKIKTLRHHRHPHAEAAVWLPLDRTRERRFGGEHLAKSEFELHLDERSSSRLRQRRTSMPQVLPAKSHTVTSDSSYMAFLKI